MQHLRKGKSLALKVYDTFDKSFVKNPAECLLSSSHAIVCDFFDFVYLFSIFFSEALLKNVPVERATLLRRLMRKTTSCKETRESPGCSSSLIGQKKFFLANQKAGFQTLLELVR